MHRALRSPGAAASQTKAVRVPEVGGLRLYISALVAMGATLEPHQPQQGQHQVQGLCRH